LPRKTDSHNPADWLLIATSDMDLVRLAAEREISFIGARSKLAEVLEKVMKAELLRLGWELEKTHDLNRLLQDLVERGTDLLPAVEPLCDALAQVYFTDRYPGFDLDDPDWPKLRSLVAGVAALLETVRSRLPPAP
jgi:HEPN domain-containing protein